MSSRPTPRTLSAHARRFARDERAAASVTALFTSLTVLMIGGVAVDHAHGVSARAQLQAVADAASHAAVLRLREGPDAARAAAREIADAHRPGLLSDADIVFGDWTDGGFARVDDPAQATTVAVRTQRAAANGNPLPPYLMRLVGVDSLDVSAVSVASMTGGEAVAGPCSGGGFFAKGRSVGNTRNTYSDGFCLHGEMGVQFHNQNRFDSGATISMPNLSDFQAHNNNPGADAALRAHSHEFTLPQMIPDAIAAMRAGTLEDAGLPDFVTLGPVYLASIDHSDALHRDTLYIVSGDVSLRDPRVFENIAIVASGNITVNSNVTFDNVILAAEGHVTFNSNIEFGGSEEGYCDRGVYGGYVLGQQGIVWNSNNELRGILMASQGDVVFNSNNRATDGIYVEAGGDIVYNSRQQLRGCTAGLINELSASTGAEAQAVRYALVR